MKKNNNNIYAWGCDLENFRGEGILGLKFLRQLSNVSKRKIFVESPTRSFLIYKNKISNVKTVNKKNINFSFFYNYLYPFYGVLKIRKNITNYEKVCYVNFLPLWNVFLFLFLPKKTILGPITGSDYVRKINSFSNTLKKYFFPILYRISTLILKNRKKLLFSTSILKNYFKIKNKNQVIKYDYNILNFKNQKNLKNIKSIDLLLYFRNYSAHGAEIQKNIITRLADKKYKIFVVGDKILHPRITNLGIIKRKKIFEYLKKTKFTINEASNFISIFALDSLSCGVQIFYNRKSYIKQKYFLKNFFVPIEFYNLNRSLFLIEKRLKNYKKISLPRLETNKLMKNYNSYFQSYFNEKR